MGINTVHHPTYCPDLAPSDFWLFPKPRGNCYETIEEKKEAVTKVIDTLTKEDFHEVFQTLCTAAGGDYFEGDKSFICVLSIKVWKLLSCTSYHLLTVDRVTDIYVHRSSSHHLIVPSARISLTIPIGHRFWQVLRVTPSVLTELL